MDFRAAALDLQAAAWDPHAVAGSALLRRESRHTPAPEERRATAPGSWQPAMKISERSRMVDDLLLDGPRRVGAPGLATGDLRPARRIPREIGGGR
jgi:hypothetical protein